MKKNMGTIDKVVRLLFALSVGVLIGTGVLTGTTAIVFGALAAIMVVTSAVSFCPLYVPIHLNTRKKEAEKTS